PGGTWNMTPPYKNGRGFGGGRLGGGACARVCGNGLRPPGGKVCAAGGCLVLGPATTGSVCAAKMYPIWRTSVDDSTITHRPWRPRTSRTVPAFTTSMMPPVPVGVRQIVAPSTTTLTLSAKADPADRRKLRAATTTRI